MPQLDSTMKHLPTLHAVEKTTRDSKKARWPLKLDRGVKDATATMKHLRSQCLQARWNTYQPCTSTSTKKKQGAQWPDQVATEPAIGEEPLSRSNCNKGRAQCHSQPVAKPVRRGETQDLHNNWKKWGHNTTAIQPIGYHARCNTSHYLKSKEITYESRHNKETQIIQNANFLA